MSSERRRVLTALLLALIPGVLGAQSTLERTPNLSGGWSGVPGQAYFNFLHRFQVTDAPARKVTNSPTFLLGYAPVSALLLGVNYATASTVFSSYPNEWELFGRWAAIGEAEAPVAASVQAGYNEAARSVDGAIDLSRAFGKVRALATLRVFSDAFGAGSEVAAGGGALLSLGPVVLGGDYVRLLDGSQDGAWGAALQWRIPHTPHTLSLQATNTGTGTLQGASRGIGSTSYGFEFTVPITLARYFGGSDQTAMTGTVAAPGDTGAVVAPGDTSTVVARSDTGAVTVTIKNLAYAQPRIEITAGTTVRWVNEDPVEHTVTDTRGRFDSGTIRPNGGVYSRTFNEPGEYAYQCTPHPFMKAVVVVKPRSGA